MGERGDDNMIGKKEMSLFWDYLIFYPNEYEEGFDGEHYGGIKGISNDAPDEAKKAFRHYMKLMQDPHRNV